MRDSQVKKSLADTRLFTQQVFIYVAITCLYLRNKFHFSEVHAGINLEICVDGQISWGHLAWGVWGPPRVQGQSTPPPPPSRPKTNLSISEV